MATTPERILLDPELTSIFDELIFVPKNSKLQGITFDRCIFRLAPESRLLLDNCTIVDCEFVGELQHPIRHTDLCELVINSCSRVSACKISRRFSQVQIVNSEIFKMTDTSTAKIYRFSESVVIDSRIAGVCTNLILRKVVFRNNGRDTGIWNKAILSSAECTQATFKGIKVHPFYLATKCVDKSSLDLSGAHLIDNWSQLRKKYSGVNLFIVFLLTFIFLLPLLTHSFVLILTGKLDPNIVPLDRIPLWEAILFGGKQGLLATGYAILTILLIIYNAGRIWITLSIAKLREEEKFLKDSDFQSVSVHPDKYRLQVLVSKLLQILLWISVLYSLLKLIDTALILVPDFG